MIKYDKHLHSFSYDGNPSSSEMPSIEDIRKDKYGDVILRMIKLMKSTFFLVAINSMVNLISTSALCLKTIASIQK